MTEVKETKELLVALVKLGKLAAKQLGDGVDLSDAVAVAKALADEEFRKAILDGFAGIQDVPAELKEVDAGEAIALIGVLYAELQK
ncbi:MAG: hypothetical protein EBR82_23810 [Caulobacteraceae bacterium]|nr:hypothetical protein [Caulobacteraceae bacterium]